MKKIITLLLIAAISISAISQEKDVRIAVLNFENESFFDSEKLGKFVGSMYETSFINAFATKVADRGMVTDYVEKNKGDDYSEFMKALKNELSLDYIITGSITEFGVKSTGTKVSAKASEANSGLGGGTSFKRGKGTSRLAIDVKITDLSTGDVVFKKFTVGEAKSKNSVIGLEFLTGDLSTSVEFEGGTIGFDETLGGQAARHAIEQSIALIKEDKIFKTK